MPRMNTALDDREFTVLISAWFVIAGSVRFRRELQRVPEWRWLAIGMACLVLGNTATLLEHFAAYDVFDQLEHVGYCLQSLALATWAYRVRRARLCRS